MTEILIGLFSGIILGMGMGGGTLMIPALVLIAGLDHEAAAGVNLIAFLPAAAVACFFNNRKQLLDTKTLRDLLPLGVAGALLGAAGAMLFDVKIVKYGFYALLIVMGMQLLSKAFKK